MKPNFVCNTILIFLGIANNGCGHRILSIFLIAGRSNMNYFDPIHLELAKNGHSITVITPTPSLVKHPNIKEFSGLNFTDVVKGMVSSQNFFQMRLEGERMSTPFASMATKFSLDCDAFHQLPVIQKLIAEGPGQFDLVMTMMFMNECVFGIFHHLNVPSIIISTIPTMPWFTGVIGSPTPLSFVPHIYFEGDQQMSFLERLGNIGTYAYQMITRNYIFLPAIAQTYQKHIPNAPGVNEILRNVSMIMGAGHPSFGPIRPSMPDLIDDIGGIHCRPAKPLPAEIKEMIGNDTEFIFFSLGSIVQGHQVPEKKRQALVKTFAKFPRYRFLWKWEADLKDDVSLPENVKISKWFPQQDILGHPKCKLFITHGGLSSLHESIYHNVPVIGIPFFGDQDWNMKQVEYHGIGRKLELSKINEKTLTQMLNELLNNPRYAEKMSRHSKLFRDRQVSALDGAVWNIEYVLRHEGAPHLRSPARDMNILQYYCVDIIIFGFIVVIIQLSLTVWCLCKVCKEMTGKEDDDGEDNDEEEKPKND